MISVPGIIKVRSIDGRNGQFNVGTLESAIGSFTVKDPSIEEFDEGSYEGDFLIESIRPNSYFSSGRMVVEVRAYLNAIILKEDVTAGPVEPEQFEQDPLEQEDKVEFELADGNDVAAMFGELWPLGKTVRLDPAVNRALFRRQKEYLKQNGYRFVASGQHWVRA